MVEIEKTVKYVVVTKIRCASTNIFLLYGGTGDSHNPKTVLLSISGRGLRGGNLALENAGAKYSSNTKIAVERRENTSRPRIFEKAHPKKGLTLAVSDESGIATYKKKVPTAIDLPSHKNGHAKLTEDKPDETGT